jgi:FKBP12-rapamycin complex-associated protein
LAEWEELSKLCKDIWSNADIALRRELAPTAAHAAWHMGQWPEMAEYVTMIESNGSLGSMSSTSTPGVTGPMVNVAATSTFLHAVLKIHNGEIDEGLMHIEQSRELLATELTARVGESYERAYGDMIRVQQLVELEEVIEYSTISSKTDSATSDSRKSLITKMWHDRLWGVQRNVEVWQALLSVRSLVLPVSEDSDTWLKFASLCRKSGRLRQSKRTLIKLLNYDPESKSPGEPGYGAGSSKPQAMYSYCKYLWSIGKCNDAYDRLQELSQELKAGSNIFNNGPNGTESTAHKNGIFQSNIHSGKPLLQARVYLKRGLWHWSLMQDEMDEKCISEILSSLRAATESARGWSKAWHHWALFNVAAMEYHSSQAPSAVARHVAPAVLGFFRSIALSQSVNGRRGSSGNLQDILRLLTLWFNHGDQADVEAALIEGFGHVSIDTWLLVIPQIIARIHTNSARVRQLIQSLFMRIGRHHPQALMYPLLVACKSSSSSRRAAAISVLDNVRQHSATLVEQAQLVSQELIRMAVLWHEMWHEALEDASRLYFGENNVDAMLNVLLPLHILLEKNGPETLQEIAFIQAYGRELQEAHEWCNKYRVSRKEAELHQAWDLYYHVFKRINKQLPSLTTLQLQYVAPALVRAQGLELAVPGTYVAGEPVVTISSFAPQLNVITSKQRPRKLTIHGGDGSDYVFLLKGHEDLRQDERVMQLFGLVNTLLQNDRNTSEHDLSIARYSVTPLSPNSGLIGWVPNCDTLHTLIREFRESRKIPLNIEHRLMMAMAPDYEHLPLINKVEVFEHALNETTGDDLGKVLWLKSRTSEVWLDRRTNYTRSLAVMSVVGYILGLGDRHPSNLMLDRHSGKILHIDFGDCFEASMNREKFPEKVPFRLTRMLVQAMGVSGVEGNYRSTCEKVMVVLRDNKDSAMAMLEAFVHDPLINWRLLQKTDTNEGTKEREGTATGAPVTTSVPDLHESSKPNMEVSSVDMKLEHTASSYHTPSTLRDREMAEAQLAQLEDAKEVLNERAVTVMKRLGDKLTGRDFSPDGESIESDSVPAQVQRLVQQATSHECLCQNYIGWCPFW